MKIELLEYHLDLDFQALSDTDNELQKLYEKINNQMFFDLGVAC